MVINCKERSYLDEVRMNVLMMAYNNEAFIEKALNALLKNPHIQHIVVIEGAWNPNAEPKRSSDNTIEILKKFPSIHLYHWDQIPIEDYEFYQCERHREIVRESFNHTYYNGPTLQQQLLARDFGLRKIIALYDKNEDPGWLFMVDSDEVYEQESIDNLYDFICAMGTEYDFFNVLGMNFYFDYDHYVKEWFRRVFRIKPNCFFSDDNSLEIPNEHYTRSMNIDEDFVRFFHYAYIGVEKVKKKLELWREDSVEKWLSEHMKKLTGEEKYNGEAVHLFGDLNHGYSGYVLKEFKGVHP